MKLGDCVKIPDGRVARVRSITGRKVRVRVRRKTSSTNQFLLFLRSELIVTKCPSGWMSTEGYTSYLKKTLGKMQKR